MQITIGQEEFDQAMQCWLDKQGFSTKNFTVSVNVIAGRKFGTSAEITLTPIEATGFSKEPEEPVHRPVFGGE